MPGFSRQIRFATSFSWWLILGTALPAGFSRAFPIRKRSPAEAGWGAGLHQKPPAEAGGKDELRPISHTTFNCTPASIRPLFLRLLRLFAAIL